MENPSTQEIIDALNILSCSTIPYLIMSAMFCISYIFNFDTATTISSILFSGIISSCIVGYKAFKNITEHR